VRVRHRRHAAAKVNELADPLAGNPGHGASEEPPVLNRNDRDQRCDGDLPICHLTIRLEIVLAAEKMVVNPGQWTAYADLSRARAHFNDCRLAIAG